MIPVTAYFRNASYGLGFKRKQGGLDIISHILLMVPTTAYPDSATIKDLFHLDYVELSIKDVIDGVEKLGCRAGVIVGGPNSRMRSAGRLSGLREKIVIGGVEKIIEWLNDGGLNTKGTALALEIVDNVFTSFTAKFNFKSAFYLSSLDFGFIYRWRNATNTGWDEWNYVSLSGIGQIPANQTLNLDGLVPMARPVTELILAEMKPYFTNIEGTYEGVSQILYPRLKPIQLQQYGWSNNPTTYYINDDVIVAGGNESSLTGLWANADMSGGKFNTTLQLWKDARYYYTYGYNGTEDIWCFLSLVDSDPPQPEPTYSEYAFVYFTSDTNLTGEQISDAMISITPGPGWVTGTIFSPLYPSPNEGKWYATNSLTTLVSNGWYVQGNNGIGATRAKKIISGEVAEEWENEK